MKPLLVIPPAPTRCMSVEALLDGASAACLSDLRQRFHETVSGATDAFAIIPNGSLTLAFACIRRRGDVGVLGELFTRPDHRMRGFGRSLLQTLLSWFDMTGGKWLYLTSPADLAGAIFENFGFNVLHRFADASGPRVTMIRALSHAAASPYAEVGVDEPIRDVATADWPALVAMLQHFPGPDPRAAINESAVVAEAFASDLLRQQRDGECQMLGAVRGGRIVGLGSLAVNQLGRKSYAILMPHSPLPEALRTALLELGKSKGYEHVEFPLLTLAGPTATTATS